MSPTGPVTDFDAAEMLWLIGGDRTVLQGLPEMSRRDTALS